MSLVKLTDQEDNFKGVILKLSADWEAFVNSLNELVNTRFSLRVDRHIGIPREFPCIVLSSFHESVRQVEHHFVYPCDAEVLLEVYNTRSRLELIKRNV